VPSDPITSFGGNAATGEEVIHAIDDLTSKYLNFGANGGAPFVGPVGLVVTPAAGATKVVALRFYTANDAVERDPADCILEGSNDGGTTYTLVSSNSLALPDGRNQAGNPLNPTGGQFLQEVRFNNAGGYKTYKLSFTRVKNPAAANSMQIGEIEFLGTVVPYLSIRKSFFDEYEITSTMAGTLQSTTSLNPPISWHDEGTVTAGSPFAVGSNPSEPTKFFRLIAQ
jgi:hypothetical protein